jgi:hypothetical protein
MNEFKNLVPVENLEIKELSPSVVVNNSSIKYLTITVLLIGVAVLSVYFINREKEWKNLMDEPHPNHRL